MQKCIKCFKIFGLAKKILQARSSSGNVPNVRIRYMIYNDIYHVFIYLSYIYIYHISYIYTI